VLDEIWGSDHEFLEKHGRSFRRLVAQERLAFGCQLLAQGRTVEARRELSRARDGVVTGRLLASRALAMLPGPLARAIIGLGRRATQHAFFGVLLLPQSPIGQDWLQLDLSSLWDFSVAALT
jgi:hypothetical protein